jgi:hypothetical protein
MRNAALKVGLFIWHYFEMMLAMGVGSTLFELLVRRMPESTSYANGLQPGTFLYTSGIAFSMVFVMLTWMIVRGHGWRHSMVSGGLRAPGRFVRSPEEAATEIDHIVINIGQPP